MHVVRADSFASRLRGLARRDDWPAAAALLLPRCRSVHTFGMRFSLDLVWLGPAGAVVRVDRAVPRRRLRLCLRARAVLECHAGQGGILVAEARRMPELAEL